MGKNFLAPARWLEHDRQVRPYVRWHRFFSGLQTLFLIWSVVALLRSGSLVAFESALIEKGTSGFSLYLWFFGTLAAVWEILTFPLSVGSYLTDRWFGLSKQRFFSWYVDHVKGLVVGAALGLIVLLFIWFCVTYLGSWWWVTLTVFFIFFSVVLAQLAPVVLVPLFFKMQPLPQGELRRKLLEMSGKFGVPIQEIYLLGLGAKTEKGNAAFMGLGRTKRIAIGDTIYEKYPAEQVLAVFAHELGHLVHWDIWKGLFFSACSLFLTFGLADFICRTWVLPTWFTWLEAPFGLFLYFVVVSLLGIPLGLLERIFSRWREREADRFASENLNMARPLADALESLTYQNRSYFFPHPLREFWLYSHPAPWRRIRTLLETV
jgi:STE24 endopeptidase